MYSRTIAIALVAFLVPTVAMATASYYEFNPDYSQSLLVASSDTVSEVFLPLNEFLSGFDFWVSNANQGGDATFTLYNPSDIQLAQTTVAVPAIADSPSGTRFHVNLPSQHSVNGALAYRIVIATSSPTLRLYYSAQTQLLAHNGSPVQQYSGGLARIGTEDKGFGFNLALYESKETSPPIISSVGTSQTVIDEVLLTFNANEPVDYQVTYGANTLDWTGTYSTCLPTIQVCTIRLPVSPSTTYPYTLTVRDIWGNTSSFTGSFTSLAYGQTPAPTPTPSPTVTATPSVTPTPTPDTVAPIITNARAVDLAPNSVALVWTTDTAANGTVVVQLTPVLITAGGNSDATLELEHYVAVSGLTEDTYYQATITSADTSNNKAVAVVTFLTPKAIITPSPIPTSSLAPTGTPNNPPATATPPAGPGDGSGTSSDTPVVSWSPPATGEPSGGYRVDVFDSGNTLIRTITVPAGTHQVTIAGLASGDQRVIVYGNDNGVYKKVATPIAVTVHKKSFTELLFIYLPYVLVGIVVLIAIIVIILSIRKPKPPVPLVPLKPQGV